VEPVLLSVCIPVFNCRKHIAQAVDSVLGQTFGDFELIIIDNCSDDGTYELLSGYSDPRLKLLRNDRNIGAQGNWNRVLQEASGTYVKLVCADDYIYPDCLERQLSVLEREGANVVMVCCDRDIVDEGGRKRYCRHYPGSGGVVGGKDAIRKIVRYGANVVGDVSAVIFRREAAHRAGEFDGSIPYVIDLDFWVRMLQHGDLFVMREPLSAYRVSGGAWSVAIAGSQAANFSAFINKVARVYGVELTSFDMVAGKVMARLNSQLRQAFYRFYLGR
jgi:glycosyltransferase involved in cell wall biosynthesis